MHMIPSDFSLRGYIMKSNRWACTLCDAPTYRGDWPCGNRFCEVNYRVLRGFTYKGEPKKEKPTVHRWKTDKQTGHGWYTGSSFKRDWKHFTKRKHRAWQRDMLRNERYEEFYSRSYKETEDPWSWD